MTSTIVLPQGYRDVVLIAVGAIPLLSFLHGLVVTASRKGAGIRYPNAYATPQQVKDSPVAYRFNCMQRAHAQYLENMPQTIASLLIAGLEFPRATTALGLGWISMRLVYALGYVYSVKRGGNGRLYGAPFWFMQGGLWFLSILTAVRKM